MYQCNPHWGWLLEKGIVSGSLLDFRGVCIIEGRDFLNAVCGQLAAAPPWPCPLACFKRFTPRIPPWKEHFSRIYRQVLSPFHQYWPVSAHLVRAYLRSPLVGPVCSLQQCRSSIFLRWRRVAGALPFRVKARCLKLQPVSTSAGLRRTKSSIEDEPWSSLLTDWP